MKDSLSHSVSHISDEQMLIVIIDLLLCIPWFSAADFPILVPGRVSSMRSSSVESLSVITASLSMSSHSSCSSKLVPMCVICMKL